jgi:hypothetical protein
VYADFIVGYAEKGLMISHKTVKAGSKEETAYTALIINFVLQVSGIIII